MNSALFARFFFSSLLLYCPPFESVAFGLLPSLLSCNKLRRRDKNFENCRSTVQDNNHAQFMRANIIIEDVKAPAITSKGKWSVVDSSCSSGNDEAGVDNPLGPPKRISELRIDSNNNDDDRNNDNTNYWLSFERPYFDPSFEDLSTPGTHSYRVKRLARNSDVFYIEKFLTPWECDAIINEAKYNYNMTVAESTADTQSRKNCSVAWFGDARLGGICGMIGRAVEDAFVTSIAKESPQCKRSALQVLNYKVGGSFVLHHDGLERILTVIMYLNGIGETWLPLVDVTPTSSSSSLSRREINIAQTLITQQLGDGGNIKVNNEKDNFGLLEEAIQHVINNDMIPGITGILVKGDGSMNHYNDDSINNDKKNNNNNNHVISIQPGDAIAFYSYCKNGQKDWRSIHAGLPVEESTTTTNNNKEGKWIATSWFHAPSLAS